MENITDFNPYVQQQPSYYCNTSPATTTTEGEERGGESGGATPITCPPQLVNFAYDTIHINFWIDWSRSWKFGLFPALAEKKAYLQSGNDTEMPFHMGKSEIFSFNLQRTGSHFQPYCLTTGDVRMYLSPRDHGSSNPNMVLQIGSLSSHQDPVTFVAQYRNWVNYLGGVIIKEDVTRIDLCADFKIAIEDTGMFSMDHWITRANHHSFYGSNRRNTTVNVGKSDIRLRVYDKQLEMLEKKEWEKLEFFNSLWGTEIQDRVTRVEFQLRGEVLKQMFQGEKPLAILSMNTAYIWSMLTEKWFRLSATVVDRENNNQAHTKVSEFWQDVQKASGFKVPPIKRNRKQKHINLPDLEKQIAGCALTYCAGLGHVADDFTGMISTVKAVVEKAVKELFKDPTFKQRFQSKQISAMVTF